MCYGVGRSRLILVAISVANLIGEKNTQWGKKVRISSATCSSGSSRLENPTLDIVYEWKSLYHYSQVVRALFFGFTREPCATVMF